ncbi:MAG TPA: triose-phosphate isomerase [Armatimonadetes bacterium]|nr:triose-phosphate isomerase [Armatimonadota bacterium]
MSKRVAVAAANWKMNKTRAEADAYLADLKAAMAEVQGRVEVIVFAPFTLLDRVAAGAAAAKAGVGGQDCYWKASGAYTGEVSVPMLADVGCTHVLVGHSERRGRFGVPEPELEGDLGRVFGDTDTSCNIKVKAVLDGGLVPCLCVGETLAEREAGNTDSVIAAQLEAGLAGLGAGQVSGLLLAYEPVWSIGTGAVCEADEAQRVCALIRATVAKLFDQASADAVRVLYGGSMKASNVEGLLAQPDIDGGLVGGASLTVADFKPIIACCAAS